MPAQLLLRLPAEPGGPVAWLACDDGRITASGDDALTEGATLATGKRVVALAPGSSVLLTHAFVPSRKPQHIRLAVPFLLEERLAADVAGMHFAIGPRDADGKVAVAAVDRDLLAGWLASLDAAGLAPDALVPETLALPLPGEGWLLAADASSVLLRCGRYAGSALDRDALEVLLRGAVADAVEPPPVITVCGIDAGTITAIDERVTAQPSDPPDLAALLASGSADPPALDLLQGAFAPQAQGGSRWRDWRRPLMLAACLLVLLFGERLWKVQRLDAESERLAERMHTTLRESAPEITRVVDPVAQMRQQLDTRRGDLADARFLDLLAISGEALAAETGWYLAGLNYRDGTLQLQLRMPGFDHFERLRSRFADRGGVVAEIGSLGSVEGEVRGSVTLRGPET